MSILVHALPAAELAELHRTGRDAHQNLPEPRTSDGGDQLRCCLRLSEPGERMLLVAHAPLPVHCPWREVGPVWVHADQCPGPDRGDRLPGWLDETRLVLRAYTRAGAMAYDHNRVHEPGGDVNAAVADILGHDDVAEVHVRNWLAQCFVCRVTRAD